MQWLKPEPITKEHGLCRGRNGFALKVFMNVHRKLPKLINVHRLAVLAFRFTYQSSFARFENYVELGSRFFEWFGLESEKAKCLDDGCLQRLSLFPLEFRIFRATALAPLRGSITERFA